MRDLWSSIPPWANAAMAVVLIPVAAYAGGLWSWTVGAASLAILAVPTCLAALSGNRAAAAATALISATGCVLEAGFAFGHANSDPDWGFAMLSFGVLLGLSGTIIGVVEPMQRELNRLGRQTTDYLRDLYDQTRHNEGESNPPAPAAKTDHGTGDKSDAAPGPDAVNYPMLLLTLQDIGRRISSDLDLDTLVPTIISTATHLLKSDHCQLFFWNSQTGSLKNTSAGSHRDGQIGFVPHPQRGVGRWVIEHRHIITRGDIHRDYTLRGLLDEEADLPDAVAPLTVGGELLGILVLHGIEQDSTHFSRLLYILTNISALAIKNAQLFQRIEEMARHDGLTGLLNHASFQQALGDLCHVAGAESQPLAVIMGDVDHFKNFNDTHGHQAGDHVLRETARLWQAVLPDYAVLARYGGEEFICALPNDDTGRAAELAELLRSQLESFPLDFEGRQLKVTASFGVAELGRPARNAPELIRLADEALYRAKDSGRNRVCAGTIAEPTRPVEHRPIGPGLNGNVKPVNIPP